MAPGSICGDASDYIFSAWILSASNYDQMMEALTPVLYW